MPGASRDKPPGVLVKLTRAESVWREVWPAARTSAVLRLHQAALGSWQALRYAVNREPGRLMESGRFAASMKLARGAEHAIDGMGYLVPILGHGFGAVRISFTRPLLARFLSSSGSPRREGLDRSLATPAMVQGDRGIPVPDWHACISNCSARSRYRVQHGLRHCVGLVGQQLETNDAAVHHPNG